jgi:hypothetical protein
MNIVYPFEFHEGGNSIFLAGPTPRSPEVPGWRESAIQLFRDKGFTGTIISPEDPARFESEQLDNFDYENQVDWEFQHLFNSSMVMFWIPRQLETMPAFTTNVEFGMVMESRKNVYLGFPKGSPKNKYLQWHADRIGMPVFFDLERMIDGLLKLMPFIVETERLQKKMDELLRPYVVADQNSD